MKKLLLLTALLAYISLSSICHAQTFVSVMDGNWSNPATWGGVPPLGTGNVIIANHVTLDADYSHISGDISISSTGTLDAISPVRMFALNFPSGTANLTINDYGQLNIPRILLNSGIVNISGSITADSLLNSASVALLPTESSMNVNQLFNYTNGFLLNAGTITSVNFLNTETFQNQGTLISNDLFNSKSFTNTADGNIIIMNNFSNKDTLSVSPAVFDNDGAVEIQNNFYNGNTINGSGKFCVGNYSYNAGSMNETIDFCDITGGAVDLNTGTIAGTVTYCLYSCTIGDPEAVLVTANVYPNPCGESVNIVAPIAITEITITGTLGATVLSERTNTTSKTINVQAYPKGIYIYKLTLENGQIQTGKLIVE